MTVVRLTGGSLVGELLSTSSERNTLNWVTRSDHLGDPRGCCNFVALVGRNRLNDGSVSRHISSRLSCQRRTNFVVVKNHLSLDYGMESSSYVDENSTMDEQQQTSSMERSLELTKSVKSKLLLLTLPAIAGQAIEPLTQLMETTYIDRLGPVELASAGVSMSIFNIISKLFNIPLLSVATFFVAEDISKNASRVSTSDDGNQHEIGNGKPFDGIARRHQLSSVSTALFLVVVIGILEALALYLGSGFFLTLMGMAPIMEMLRLDASADAQALAYVLYILQVGVTDQMTEPTQRSFLVVLSNQLQSPDSSPSMRVAALRTLSYGLKTFGEVPLEFKEVLDNTVVAALSLHLLYEFKLL